ncbi:unnamed protein product [Caenorhabditis angaria]|uniref:Uncharacterized protein n=1 Tax=Caenorhabditis angaria TaxID=860376 RepID=A0A9P1N4I9_9PELO|nr:unnamed protein product [Caenorhabditis angaria]
MGQHIGDRLQIPFKENQNGYSKPTTLVAITAKILSTNHLLVSEIFCRFRSKKVDKNSNIQNRQRSKLSLQKIISIITVSTLHLVPKLDTSISPQNTGKCSTLLTSERAPYELSFRTKIKKIGNENIEASHNKKIIPLNLLYLHYSTFSTKFCKVNGSKPQRSKLYTGKETHKIPFISNYTIQKPRNSRIPLASREEKNVKYFDPGCGKTFDKLKKVHSDYCI